MKSKNLKMASMLLLTITLSIFSTISSSSNCERYYCKADGDINNTFVTNVEDISANIAAATFAASVDLLPDAGHWRLDGALTNVSGENGAGLTLMHRFNGDYNWAMGASAGISDGYEVFRVQGGLQFR